MPRGEREVGAGLLKKGFLARENDHTFYHLYVAGKKTPVYTKISHGEREIGEKLLGMMARQVGLSKRDFLDLIDCPLTFDEYLELLRAASKIEPAAPTDAKRK